MPQDKFEFSGLPNWIEWYECYDDRSKQRWMDGMELAENRHQWDERAIAKWHFFYRPYPPVVGRPQKKRINERRATISVCEDYLRQTQESIAREQLGIQRLRRNATFWGICLTGFDLLLIWAFAAWEPLILLVVALCAVFYRFEKAQRAAAARIATLQSFLAQYQATIRQTDVEIQRLEGEIKHLLAQIPQPVHADQIKRWYEEEVANAELACLSDLVGKQVTRETADEYLTHQFGDRRVFGLLVDSWGCLQPMTQRGASGVEGTGLRRASEDLGEHVATWQVGSGDAPVFRLCYLQFILPFAKNLNTHSFFYDFITRRQYGLRTETFQYNHVTNFAIREIDPRDESVGPASGGAARGTRLDALTIYVASGNHFQCVLVGKDVVEFLNESLKQEEKYLQLSVEPPSMADLRTRFPKLPQAKIDDLLAQEKARMEGELLKVIREQQKLRLASASSGRVVLDHVRACVENYVSRVDRPA